MKRLPKKFKIFARTVDIDYAKLTDIMGLCQPDKGRISVMKSKDYPRAATEASLFHEIAHYLAYALNEPKLYSNEKFIDLLGQMLHQLWETLE